VTNVFNGHDLSDLEKYLRDDYIQHKPDYPQGRSEFSEFFDPVLKAMPDFHYELLDILSQRDRV
jgi:predicted SnoaL-like aldol condensation-catalyzing enzyme